MAAEKRRKPETKLAPNWAAYALGKPVRNGFHVRKVVWGKTLASYERRPDEEIRLAIIRVGTKKVRPVTLDEPLFEKGSGYGRQPAS